MTAKQQILLVDNDDALRYLCGGFLEREGYQVTHAVSRAETAELLCNNPFNLVLLDRDLPDGDGLELGGVFKKSDIPFIIMSCRCRPEERLAGFKAGAADYLGKPFHPEELLYRMEKVLPSKERRTTINSPRRHRIGNWLLDLDQQYIEAGNGKRFMLTYGEYRLLALLDASNGQTVSREQLMEAVSRCDGEGHYRSVDVLISRLRKKLGDHPRRPTLLKTVPNAGYRLEKRSADRP